MANFLLRGPCLRFSIDNSVTLRILQLKSNANPSLQQFVMKINYNNDSDYTNHTYSDHGV